MRRTSVLHCWIKRHVAHSAEPPDFNHCATLSSGIVHSPRSDVPLAVSRWITWRLPNSTGLRYFNHHASLCSGIVHLRRSTSPLILNRQINHHITNFVEGPSFNKRTSSRSRFNIDHRSHLDRSTIVDLFITLNFAYTYLPHVFESAEIIRALDFYPFDFAPLDFYNVNVFCISSRPYNISFNQGSTGHLLFLLRHGFSSSC